MLFFSKPTPYLIDLIPDNHIDMHSHLLPGIDDGSSSLIHTLSLIESMYAFGITSFVTTPHVMKSVWDNSTATIKSAEQQLNLELQKNTSAVTVHAAAEYLMDDYFIKLIQTEPLLTLKENYVLVEMSYMNPPLGLYSILHDLQEAGYVPVLAHPERYLFYQNNFQEFEKLKKAGCLFQLNCNAVTGYYGRKVAEVAQQLLQKGMYDFIGSDVHHERHIEAMKKKIICKYVPELEKLFSNNQIFR
ncbi:tyrosine-protein phosphatase [Flavobacterium sp. TAB 87]|uniref:tyrosine-protein phosphatase n=1 Tax=Flavobacterium sp. TAB 87 TaxID=1729581 RepID=UPI00076DD188|nr:CpsB/CapC family capsule biosynthesis tyrosine phosphatase [Flavobacterium sp. TAB 87]KVV15108.1 Tyrosine-protein phosphatase YwqE [Flavobacterium sp. TAB 87]